MDPKALAQAMGPAPQEMRAYEPTWRDRLATWMAGDEKMSPERRRLVEGLTGSTGLGTSSAGVVDATPGGVALAVNEAQRAKEAGNATDYAINSIGSLATFAGVGARTAKKAAIKMAEEMLARGASRDAIFNATKKEFGQGWFPGPDGKLRFEIDDSNSKFNHFYLRQSADGDEIMPAQTIEQALRHPELYKAYPELRGIKFDANVPPNQGRYSEPAGGAMPRISVGALDGKGPDHGRAVALHELQHAIQSKEGHALGGSDVLTPDQYHRLAGEVEARNTMFRRNLTMPERHAAKPWLTEDTPTPLQIVQFWKRNYWNSRGGK